MLRRLAISVVAIATVTACGTTAHNSTVVHNSAVGTAIAAVATPDTTPYTNAFDQPGYECYAQDTDVICKATGKPVLVKPNALTATTCPFYTDLVWEGKLAPEVVYDPASPCRRFPAPTIPTCADQPDTACVEADGTIR